MSKRKFEPSSNDNDEFVFPSASCWFKKFKIKLISHIDISSDKNDKSFSSFNKFQFLAKNVNSCRNDLIIAKSNFKEFIKN